MQYHQTVGRVLAEGARYLAEKLIVPFGVTDFSKKVKELVDDIERDKGNILSPHVNTSKLLKVKSFFYCMKYYYSRKFD